MRSGVRSRSRAWPVGAMSISTRLECPRTISSTRRTARISSSPGGTLSSSCEKSSRSNHRSMCTSATSALVASSIISFTLRAQPLKIATASISEARNLLSPSTARGSSEMAAPKMSSKEGAGSTEQISTAARPARRVLKPRAAEIVVFPTPPFPRTIERGRSIVGHSTRDSRISRGFGFGAIVFRANFFPANICSPNAPSADPITGAPASSAM